MRKLIETLARKKHCLKYLLLTLLGLTPLLWFYNKGAVLINGVDTNFPLNPLVWFLRRFYVWNSITNGGVDFSSSTAGLFFHVIQLVPYWLGFNLQWVQIISLIFWFSLLAFSAYFLARIILPKIFLTQLLFVLIYIFNIYLFNTWENVKVANLSLIAALPLAIGVLILLSKSQILYSQAIFFSATAGVVLSGAGINPAYFVSFFWVLTIFLFAQLVTSARENLKKRLVDFLIVSSVIILINAFWILPTANYIFKTIPEHGSIDKIGFHNWIDSLSENTSALNIMRVQGAWDWYAVDSKTKQPLYIPYAINYFFRLPFLVFSFLLTTLAILALLLRGSNKNCLYISFGLMLAIGVFLGMGTHLPSGTFYRFLTDRLPFFTLFRSPWYIFTPLVTLSLAGLVSLLFDNLYTKFSDKKYSQFLKSGVTMAVLVSLTGNLLYSYPLVTGKIFRPGEGDSFYVNFPDYIFDAAKWLSSQQQGRVIGYPDDEIEKFSWGYRGIELILGLLVDRQTLFSPLNAPDAPVASLIKEFYTNLKLGKIDVVTSLAAKLNIGLIFYKTDQESLSPELPDEFASLETQTFGKWKFFKFPPSGQFLPKIYSSNELFLGYPYKFASQILPVLSTRQTLMNPEDNVISQVQPIIGSSEKMVLANNLQMDNFSEYKISPSRLANRLITRDLSKVVYTFKIPENGLYQPIIEKRKLEDFGIDPTQGLEVELNSLKIKWVVDKEIDSYIYFKPMDFQQGSYQINLGLKNNNLITGGDFNQGFIFEKGGEGRGEGRYEIEGGAGEKFLSILNIMKADISAVFAPTSFDPLALYYIEVKYRQIYGNNANVLVTQSGSNTLYKAQIERMPNHPEWKLFSFYYEPVKTTSQMKVELSSPFTNDPLGTKILYDDLKVFKLFSNNLFLIKKNQSNLLTSPQVTIEKSSPVSYQAQVENSSKPHVIIFSENYSPDWQLSLFDKQNNPIKIDPAHFSANLYANAWFIEGAPSSYKLKIYYQPQRLFFLGLTISIVTTFASALLLLLGVRKK